MKRPFAILVLAVACAACTSLPADVSAPVRHALAGVNDGTGRSIDPERLASRVQLGRDRIGWLIDYEETGDLAWCGTGGCTRELYVARADGSHSLAFSEQVLSWNLIEGPDTILDLELHRANCDAIGDGACLRRFVWDDAEERFEEALDREGFGYLVGPLFQPVPFIPGDYPEAVEAEIERREALCGNGGGVVDRGGYPAVSSPDLNGDGRRDWVLGSPYAGCYSLAGEEETMPKMGISVLVSAGDQWVVALRAESAAYVVDISVQPARLGLRDLALCGEHPDCPVRYYNWKAEDQTLHDSGVSDWRPTPIPTAETWLDCLVATERAEAAAKVSRGTSVSPELRAWFEGLASRMMEEYGVRLREGRPTMSAAQTMERRRAFEARYDDPEELEAAQWRSDSCVTWL